MLRRLIQNFVPELDYYSFLEELNRNFVKMEKILGPKFSIASTKTELFRQKLSIPFQF